MPALAQGVYALVGGHVRTAFAQIQRNALVQRPVIRDVLGQQLVIIGRIVQRQGALGLRERAPERRVRRDVYRRRVGPGYVQGVADRLDNAALGARLNHAVVLHAAVGGAPLHQQPPLGRYARARVVGAAHHACV